MTNSSFKVLIVDDEMPFIEPLLERLAYEGYEFIYASSCSEALSILKENGTSIKAAIVDSFLPLGDNPSFIEKQFKTGKTVGLELAKYISLNHPHIRIAGFSILKEEEIEAEYRLNKIYFISKDDPSAFNHILHFLKHALSQHEYKYHPNIFIVHGHDELALLELKNYLQNTLKLSEPIILKEKPSEGQTIIEKFEVFSKNIDLVFVMLTPDDFISIEEGGRPFLQARPNVIFELGYFMGKLKRKSGKIILLVKSPSKMFSDLSGVIFIDISNGINSAGESIRNELTRWL